MMDDEGKIRKVVPDEHKQLFDVQTALLNTAVRISDV